MIRSSVWFFICCFADNREKNPVLCSDCMHLFGIHFVVCVYCISLIVITRFYCDLCFFNFQAIVSLDFPFRSIPLWQWGAWLIVSFGQRGGGLNQQGLHDDSHLCVITSSLQSVVCLSFHGAEILRGRDRANVKCSHVWCVSLKSVGELDWGKSPGIMGLYFIKFLSSWVVERVLKALVGIIKQATHSPPVCPPSHRPGSTVVLKTRWRYQIPSWKLLCLARSLTQVIWGHCSGAGRELMGAPDAASTIPASRCGCICWPDRDPHKDVRHGQSRGLCGALQACGSCM